MSAQIITWDWLAQRLERARREIDEQIESYPPPIPACDQHFNHLMEQHHLVRSCQGQLREMIAQSDSKGPPARIMEELRRTWPVLDEERQSGDFGSVQSPPLAKDG